MKKYIYYKALLKVRLKIILNENERQENYN